MWHIALTFPFRGFDLKLFHTLRSQFIVTFFDTLESTSHGSSVGFYVSFYNTMTQWVIFYLSCDDFHNQFNNVLESELTQSVKWNKKNVKKRKTKRIKSKNLSSSNHYIQVCKLLRLVDLSLRFLPQISFFGQSF